MIFLPEASDFIAESYKQTGNNLKLILAELSKDQSFLSSVCECARNNKLWVSVGYHEPSMSSDRVYNSQASNCFTIKHSYK
jgi:hypothetical protein